MISDEGNLEIDLIIPESDHADKFREKCTVHQFSGIPQFDNTRYGHYTWLRWLIVFREIYFSILFKKRMKSFFKNNQFFDIIHFNEIVNFYGCISTIKRYYPLAKIVTHVRSLQYEKKTVYWPYLKKLLETKTDAIIAIDDCVSRTLGINTSEKVFLVANAFNIPKTELRIDSESNEMKLVYLGGRGMDKGIDYLLEIMYELKKRGFKGRLILAGLKEEVRGRISRILTFLLTTLRIKIVFTQSKLDEYILRNGLSDTIEKRGFIQNVAELYIGQDLLLFPSRYNAPGRPSIEAMSFGIPSIVFSKYQESNIIKNGLNGYNVLHFSISEFADKVMLLDKDRDLLKQLKTNSFEFFKSEFNTLIHKDRLLNVYRNLGEV